MTSCGTIIGLHTACASKLLHDDGALPNLKSNNPEIRFQSPGSWFHTQAQWRNGGGGFLQGTRLESTNPPCWLRMPQLGVLGPGPGSSRQSCGEAVKGM